jgi:hypothetical protein
VDLSAAQIAQLTHLNLNTIDKILTLVRIIIFELSVQKQLQSGKSTSPLYPRQPSELITLSADALSLIIV